MPVGPVIEVHRYQSRQLDAFEYDDVDDRIEHGEVARRSDAQTDIGEAFKRTPHAEESRHEAYTNHEKDVFCVHGNQVAGNQYRTYRHENGACRKPGFQTEQNREDDGHADERRISGHVHIFLDAAQGTRHLGCCRQEYSSIELKHHGKKHGQANTHGGGQKIFKV